MKETVSNRRAHTGEQSGGQLFQDVDEHERIYGPEELPGVIQVPKVEALCVVPVASM